MSGLAGQAIGLDVQSPTPIGGPAAVDAESNGSMENFIGFGLGATSYDPTPVDFDAADDTVTSAADGSTRVAPEYTDNQLTWGGSTPVDGILFDTARGDSFIGNFVAIPANGAVITASSIALNSDTPVNVDCLLLQDSDPLKMCFDTFKISVGFEINGNFGGALVPGFIVGYKNAITGWSGISSDGHGGVPDGSNAFPSRYLQGGAFGTGSSGQAIGSGIDCSNDVELVESVFNVLGVYEGNTNIDMTIQLEFASGTTELPRMFNQVGVNFKGGHIIITGVKLEVLFPNAKYALVGDSLTQGRFATDYGDSYGMLFRAAHPDNTLICGAPSANIEDWTAGAIKTVSRLGSKYAIILLGTNNVVFAQSSAQILGHFATLVDDVVSNGLVPIVVSLPPLNSVVVPEVNTGLQTTYSKYIDIYTSMVDAGTALKPEYDSGDGIHWNSAGHAHVASVVLAAITANGWN